DGDPVIRTAKVQRLGLREADGEIVRWERVVRRKRSAIAAARKSCGDFSISMSEKKSLDTLSATVVNYLVFRPNRSPPDADIEGDRIGKIGVQRADDFRHSGREGSAITTWRICDTRVIGQIDRKPRHHCNIRAA